MECVPIGTFGLFTALYVPFDLVGRDSELIKKQVSEDIKLLATGLRLMFRDVGFGAKTSSGYGQAKNTVEDGNIILKAKGVQGTAKSQSSVQPPDEPFLKYLNDEGIVKVKFKGSGESGLLSNKEYNEKGQQSGGGSLAEFKEFRRWYGQFGDKWQKELRLKNSSTDWPIWWFESFDELLKVTKEIEKSLLPKEGLQ